MIPCAATKTRCSQINSGKKRKRNQAWIWNHADSTHTHTHTHIHNLVFPLQMITQQGPWKQEYLSSDLFKQADSSTRFVSNRGDEVELMIGYKLWFKEDLIPGLRFPVAGKIDSCKFNHKVHYLISNCWLDLCLWQLELLDIRFSPL